MSILGTVKTVLEIIEDSKKVTTISKEFTSSFIQNTQKFIVPINASDWVLPVQEKGTTKYIIVWTDRDNINLTVKPNGGDPLNIKPLILLTDNLTSLTVSNSSDSNTGDLFLTIIGS